MNNIQKPEPTGGLNFVHPLSPPNRLRSFPNQLQKGTPKNRPSLTRPREIRRASAWSGWGARKGGLACGSSGRQTIVSFRGATGLRPSTAQPSHLKLFEFRSKIMELANSRFGHICYQKKGSHLQTVQGPSSYFAPQVDTQK